MRSLRLATANSTLAAACLLAVAGFQPLHATPRTPSPDVSGQFESGRTIVVKMAVVEHDVTYNRLGAHLPSSQVYVLERDLVPSDHKFDEYGNDSHDPSARIDPEDFKPGGVRLRSYKRPRPIVLRANVGDTLQIHFRNLLPKTQKNKTCSVLEATPVGPGKANPDTRICAGVQVMGLEWGEAEDAQPSGVNPENGIRVLPGDTHVYEYVAVKEGVFMMYSPNGQSIPNSQLDRGLFGSITVQPREAEYYRSQVTATDLRFATYRVKDDFMKDVMEYVAKKVGPSPCERFYTSKKTGLPEGTGLRPNWVDVGGDRVCQLEAPKTVWQFRVPASIPGRTDKISEVVLTPSGYLNTLSGHPVIYYGAVYPEKHPRHGSPVLNMLVPTDKKGEFETAHTDLSAIITGPGAGRFPYYLDSPSFRENPASPDRRQPYREFSVHYHIAPSLTQAFSAFELDQPLGNTLAAGKDGFAVNYGTAGIAPAIYANRIGVGPQGINEDGADLMFEEFFLSSWAVGDPAMITNVLANNESSIRATKALYPDDPSNVFHSYMRDHVRFRVVNAGSVAPHVHHQHAHQWLRTPNSDDSHYLDSQMINPGSAYTMEMVYNGSGNRNQTVGDSIFHCHIYPHFAQGMWGLWRVHDVFEAGTELDPSSMIPVDGARALPDGEIVAGTPIPALVPLPSLGMAPLPAKVRLVDNGRRAEVVAEGNPGFPFFVPGIAGHRAPHPPMDFAWKETAKGEPELYTETVVVNNPFRKPGDRKYLDGGLPRHIVTDGKVVKEFHSRWDFTKEFASYDEDGNFLDGSLTAYELPEEGTAAEKAAMKAHATRAHATFQPDGLPGNFILNGLPPVPGAPYAAPDVDDAGNSNFNARRYKAAVVQTDVVFNKEGWHYPQQRFITLLDDVKPTFSGEKPPEPFFFRANTGETIEFWHTNFVPEYFELDDFQVRTPTDILGQHIHLVKFDVTASDGAANGFNYEDGTFSPDAVRHRIKAINADGGLFHYTGKYDGKGKQSKLTISHYRDDYPRVAEAPKGQNWDGAQTTIQRFDTDPLLNDKGDDRTLRTVFTHDHFGPSTHQQVGLYGALLVEPEGSTWKLPTTGCPMPANPGDSTKDSTKCDSPRTDGGPTSWQALIETRDSEESYREFAIAFGDLQLSYQKDSISRPKRVETVWFYAQDHGANLNDGNIPDDLRHDFAVQGAKLSKNATIQTTSQNHWRITSDGGQERFSLTLQNDGRLAVTTETIHKGWSDSDHAIWAPTKPTKNSDTVGEAPYPQILSGPGGKGNIGGWVVNYRNEPLDERVQGSGNSNATDPSFAYSSIERGIDRLDIQPELDSPISKDSDFKYPGKELTPGMEPFDPFTPMMRAYANDKVQIHTVVGAQDSVHSFQVQGQRWHSEPSYADSGYRDVQGMLISEHFEMLFQLPPADTNDTVPYVDYLYAPQSSSQGQFKGGWGLMRAYKDTVKGLEALTNNKPGHNTSVGFYKLPAKFNSSADRTIANGFRSFDVSLEVPPLDTGVDSPQYQLAYTVSEKRAGKDWSKRMMATQVLVLRARAGEWIQINLTNNVKESDRSKFPGLSCDGDDSELCAATYSSKEAAEKPFNASVTGGLHAMALSYDTLTSSGLNIGANGVGPGGVQTTSQTVPPIADDGEPSSKTYLWYAGEIVRKSKTERQLVPIEFGALNLIPSGALLQRSYNLYGALIIEPAGSTWSKDEAHSLTAKIMDETGENLLFTEIVVIGNNAENATVSAGDPVRFRVVNPNSSAAGQAGDGTNLIVVEGHGWPEKPWVDGSTRIGDNPLTQFMGTQQVTPLESYNLVLPHAGGVEKVPGTYGFYYYPKGPKSSGGYKPLGTLTVKPVEK